MSDNPYQRRAVTIIVRPVDEACNLACTYCNAAAYGGGTRVMDDATLERLIIQASRPRFHFIQFCWHGGEPLLAGLDFFRRVVELQKRCFGGEFWRRACENVVQTNGLLLRGALLDFLVEQSFWIGISLDGPDEEANRYRFPAQRASSLLARTIDVCKELKRRGLPLVVINVVHDANVSRARDIYEFHRSLGTDNVSFNPRFLRGQHDTSNIEPAAYVAFLEEIVALREADARRGIKTFSLGVLEDLLRVSQGNEPSTCFFANSCHRFLNVNNKGEVYASCTDALGVRLGDLDEPGLDRLILEGTRGPEPRVSYLRDGRNVISDGPLGPGCPKYSQGEGDIYLPHLRALAARLASSPASERAPSPAILP